MIAIRREGRKYRRTLEQAVSDTHGEVNVIRAHLIDTASAATIQAGICRWCLRHKLDKMSPADIRGCAGDIVRAKQARDRAVAALELEKPPESPWAGLVTSTATQEAASDG